MSKNIFKVIYLILCCMVSPQLSIAQTKFGDAKSIFKQSSNSVITIDVSDQDGTRQGSAVAIGNTINLQTLKPDGTNFYTNWHVVKSSKKITATIKGRRYVLEPVFGDPELDMAVIKLAGITIEPVKQSTTIPAIGETVYAIGSPRGLENSISQGIVSGLREDRGRQLIQTTATISPGSSGGGLFDNNGKLVGITTFRLGQSGEALNFAISVESFERLSDANTAATQIGEILQRFFSGAEESISMTRRNEFSRWLYEPQRKEVRDYFAKKMGDEVMAAGTKPDQLTKVIGEAQKKVESVLDSFTAEQKLAVTEKDNQQSQGNVRLLCEFKELKKSIALQIDIVNKTVNANPAKFTDSLIEFGDESVRFALDRYASTLAFISKNGVAKADCRRQDKRVF